MKGNDAIDGATAPMSDLKAKQQLIIKHFLNNIQATPSALIIEKLCSWLDVFPPDVIIKALDEAIAANKRSYKYVEGILNAWEEKRLVTVSLVEAHLKEWLDGKKDKSKPRQAKQTRFTNFEQRTWDFEAIEKAERARLEAL